MEQALQCLGSKVDNIIDFLSLNDVDDVRSAAGTMRRTDETSNQVDDEGEGNGIK